MELYSHFHVVLGFLPLPCSAVESIFLLFSVFINDESNKSIISFHSALRYLFKGRWLSNMLFISQGSACASYVVFLPLRMLSIFELFLDVMTILHRSQQSMICNGDTHSLLDVYLLPFPKHARVCIPADPGSAHSVCSYQITFCRMWLSPVSCSTGDGLLLAKAVPLLPMAPENSVVCSPSPTEQFLLY